MMYRRMVISGDECPIILAMVEGWALRRKRFVANERRPVWDETNCHFGLSLSRRLRSGDGPVTHVRGRLSADTMFLKMTASVKPGVNNYLCRRSSGRTFSSDLFM